jgi:hypothetical protein
LWSAEQFGQAGSLFAYKSGSNYTVLSNNSYAAGGGYQSGDARYINNGFSTGYIQNNSGQHLWMTSASGSANGAITFTQAMTLDASGNLLVGSATNAEGARLKVNNGYIFLKESGGGDIYLRSAYGGTNPAIQVASASPLLFITNNTERSRITSGGNILIGSTTDSGELLQVNGTAKITGNVTVGTRLALQPSGFGYDTAAYKTLIVGSTGTTHYSDATTLTFNVDVSGNLSGSFTGDGTEYVWRNTGSFITPNASNNAFNRLFFWNSSGQMTIVNASTFSSNVSVIGNIIFDTNATTRQIWNGGYGGAIQLRRSDVDTNRFSKIGIVDNPGNFVGGLTINSDTTATFSSSVTAASGIITGNLTVDTNTLFVDATNNRVGIGTVNPLVQLDVNGSINLASGFSLTWGGAYGANIPTIASLSGAGSYMAFYPAGSTSGERMRLDASGNLGIGASTINASAKLQIDSTTQGFLPPRMTATQRSAISSPSVGLVVYQTDGVEGLYIYTNTNGWKSLAIVN